jgi:3-methyladenine DNA glycosylase AlkC
MSEPFKNGINPELARTMAIQLQRVWSGFPEARFVRLATEGLEKLELKARVRHFASALESTLPDDFDRAASLIEASLAPAPVEGERPDGQNQGKGLFGWAVWPLTEYVATKGLPHPERALACLRELTQRSSSEFAVRPFLAANPEQTMAIMLRWLKDPSPHVRRLLSEGTRPRLPWGLQLKNFVKDPSPCIPLLDALHDDPSDYVRLSVSNHLNDISKDHPDLALEIAERWLKDGRKETRKLVSHALRSLLKAGNPKTLSLLGFVGGKDIEAVGFVVNPKIISLGDTLTIRCTLRNRGKKAVNLAVDYAVHHKKADGSLRPKVFKGTKRKLVAGESDEIRITHPVKKVTTRRYHPGKHEIELLVNGRSLARGAFTLRS